MIEKGDFWAKKENCRVFKKKGYFSKDRRKPIVVDVSIEISLPGAQEYSVLVAIECKNLSSSVPVDDVEEFSAKLQQIAGFNVKGIVASRHSFQSGAREFAKSKSIALLRLLDHANHKWELKRTASASLGAKDANWQHLLDSAFTVPEFRGHALDLCAETSKGLTATIWDLVDDLLDLSETSLLIIRNKRAKPRSAPYLDREDIEKLASNVIANCQALGRHADLDEICDLERESTGLTVELVKDGHFDDHGTLGTFDFEEMKVRVRSTPASPGRQRFTLAHELGHHFLGHGEFLRSEMCDRSDLFEEPTRSISSSGIHRLEWQANCFATSLLMPREVISAEFDECFRKFNVRTTFGAVLFVDTQPCNQDSFYSITDSLMKKFGVSREAVAYRLTSLGLMIDQRNSSHLREYLSQFLANIEATPH